MSKNKATWNVASVLNTPNMAHATMAAAKAIVSNYRYFLRARNA